MKPITKSDVERLAFQLPIDEQLELAQSLWEHASPPAGFTLSPQLRELLEARRLEAHTHPEAGIPWEDMKARLRD